MNPTVKFLVLMSCMALSIALSIAHNIAVEERTNLIEQVCEHSHNKANCVASLESNPDSKKANLTQLGVIALRLASSNATDTLLYITKLLDDTELDPSVEQALSDCSELYMDAVEQLDDSVAASLVNALDDVHRWVDAATADAESCEAGFNNLSENLKVLSKRNSIFRQLCNNALAIHKMIIQS